MKTRTKIAVGAVAVLVIGAAAWCWPSREPVYQGIGARDFVAGSSTRIVDIDKAYRFFGTNLVPYVRASLRVRDTWDRRSLVWLGDHAPWLKKGLSERYWEPVDDERVNAFLVYAQIVDGDYWGDARAACAPSFAIWRTTRTLVRLPSHCWIRSRLSNKGG